MKKFLITLLLSLTLINVVDAEIIRRAAFDFGSGGTKMQVADVDTETDHIVKFVYERKIGVPLSQDLATSADNRFSPEIQQRLISAAKELKAEATNLGATQFSGIATAAYRRAHNAEEVMQQLLEKLQLPTTIIPQEEEGRLGFLTLALENGFDQDKLVSWDIGDGSFQITFKEDGFEYYMGPYGRASFKEAIIQKIKNQDPAKASSPNPINETELQAIYAYLSSQLGSVPTRLLNKLKQPGVVLVGIGAQPRKLRASGFYNLDNVEQAIQSFLNKEDNEIAKDHNAPEHALTELAIISYILQQLEVDGVTYCSGGNITTSLLISDAYWN